VSRVLIAEDSSAIRLLLVRRLEMAGHDVIATGDGEEALKLMRSTPVGEKPEIVLLDAMMPTTDGAQALGSIKNTDPGIPVLVVSAVAGLSNSPEWSKADGHVSKPIDFDDLLGRIEALTSARPQP